MGYAASIIFGTLTIEAASINPIKIPGTRKQKVGGRVIVKSIPDRQTQDWRLTISASFSDTNRNTDRDTLQAYYDNMNLVSLNDGIHDGEYYITGDGPLWRDNSDSPNEHKFTMIIVQET